MCPISPTTFPDWQAQQQADSAFVAAAGTLEPDYQIARLRIQRGLPQAQLAEMVETRQPSIARLENGSSVPSLSFLNRVAKALGASIELHIIPRA